MEVKQQTTNESIAKSPRTGRSPAKGDRVHPCSPDQFERLNDAVEATDDIPRDVSGPSHGGRISLAASKIKYGDATLDEMETREKIEAAGGLVYLVFTIVLSFAYLATLTPTMANDLWWVGFNATGAQSYLIDFVNMQLNLRANGTLDLTANRYGIAKDYSNYYTPLQVSTTYTRTVVTENTHDLRGIIPSLMLYTTPTNVQTQFCWVDFNRTWEVAHTDARQARCYARYKDNGAVYWESLCRLIDWNAWQATSQSSFDIAIGNTLRQTPAGYQWLNLTAYGYKNLDAEVAYWVSMGVTKYEIQFTNSYTWGVSEMISITNAFGGSQSISIKRVTSASRGAMWTTDKLSWGPWNDFILSNAYKVSFVRSDPTNQRFAWPCDYADYVANPATYDCQPCNSPWNPYPGYCDVPDFEWLMGLPQTPNVVLTHNYMGQIGSIDAFSKLTPPSLRILFETFQDAVASLMQTNDAFYNAMMLIPSLSADPVPASWQGDQIQYLACATQQRNTILLHKLNVLFAIVASGVHLPDALIQLCSLCPTKANACTSVVTAAVSAWTIFDQAAPEMNALNSQIKAAMKDLDAQAISIIQFAVNNTGNSVFYNFLQQQLVSIPPAQWNFFGWLYMYDWVQGTREVVSFEGDVTTLMLMSDPYTPNINQAQALEVPQSACQYLWVVSAMVSTFLVVVWVLVLAYSLLLRGRIVGRNLFQFNRIAGSVWVGRPLLLVRGMTAIILLSTSPIQFVTNNGYARFEFQPRTFIETMVVSGEAMWITYVINDVLLVLNRHSQPHFAPISTWLGWFLYVIIDASSPYKVETNIDRKCVINVSGRQVACVSGTVKIGDLHRAMCFAVIQIACIIAAYFLAKLWDHFQKRRPGSSINGHLLLSGTATAFLNKGFAHHGEWTIDRASCVMCGLLTYRDYVFDLKLWLLVEEKDTDHVKWGMKTFPQPDLNVGSESKPVAVSPHDNPKRLNRAMAVVGLLYMCASIVGS
ncbi:hypothetical protein As57867_012758, partial [Aphanomyces stellatus]